jgi:hypothetical protein
MGAGFLFGLALSRLDPRRVIAGQGVRVLTCAALLATLMGKSLGGHTLTLAGALTIWPGPGKRSKVLLLLLGALPPIYVGTRSAGAWTGGAIVEFVETNLSARRAESFQFRLINEDLLVARAMERPWFGWAGWGRNRVNDEEGRDITTTDGHWVMAFGSHGFVGLVSWMVALLLPVWIVATRTRFWKERDASRNYLLLVAATIVALHTMDCLVNAMLNPVYSALAGGICTIAWHDSAGRRRTAETPAVPVPLPRATRPLRSRKVRARADLARPGPD